MILIQPRVVPIGGMYFRINNFRWKIEDVLVPRLTRESLDPWRKGSGATITPIDRSAYDTVAEHLRALKL